VDGAGDELLARARFSVEVDGTVGVGDLADHVVDALHRRCLADDCIEGIPGVTGDILAQVLVLLAQALTLLLHLEGLLDLESEDLGREGLGDEVEGALLHGVDGRLDRAVRRDDHDERLGLDLADGRDDLEAVHPLHLQIADGEVDRACLEGLDTGPAIGRGVGGVTHARDDLADAVAEGVVVFDDENVRHRQLDTSSGPY